MHDAYFAGLFDGEGCVAVGKRGNSIRVYPQVAMTDPRPLQELQRRFGGKVKKGITPKKPQHRQQWVWNVWGREAVTTFFTVIYPHSIVKQDQIEQALAILATIRSKGGSKKTLNLPADIIFLRQEAVKNISGAKGREFLAVN